VVAALVALPTIAALLPSRLDAVTGARAAATKAAATRAPVVKRATSVNTWRPAPKGTATLWSVTVTTGNDDFSTVGSDAMQSAAHRRIRGAGCTNPGPGTGAYTLGSNRVTGPTTAHLNPAGGPSGASSVFQAAFNTWAAADANAPSIAVATDSSVSSPRADGQYELMFAPLAGRTLAITYTWHWSSGAWESDVVFSTKAPWFIAPGEGDGCYEGVARYDLQNTATHEFGHVYGLEHVSAAFNTMAPTATMGETYKRSLASGDAAGLRAKY
jgi:hypothetical protein